MYGVSTEIEASGVEQLTLSYSVVGNIRAIRNFDDYKSKTPGFEGKVELDPIANQVRITRFLTPAHRYSMTLQADTGSQFKMVGGKVVLVRAKGSSAALRFRVTARSSEPLLTGMSPKELIREEYLHLFDEQTLNMLSFVAYREKWMAGSHRYLTYFGRDTMVSAKLMLAFLKPKALAGVLAGVLDRVDKNGWVSHEETLADYAFYESGNKSFEPIQNREHIDANYMLPGLVSDYLRMVSVEEGNAFLNRPAPDGRTYRQVVQSNLHLLLEDSVRFYQYMTHARRRGDPEELAEGWKYLVALEKDPKTGQYLLTGQWRDSGTGLDNGVFAYDVNVVLIPAALASAYDLFDDTRYGLNDAHNATSAQKFYGVWSKETSEFFKITIPRSKAQQIGERFMSQKEINLRMPRPLTEDLTYYALSLKSDGTKSRIMHSDVGQRLLYGNPDDQELMTICDLFIRHAPFGLQTGIGPVVAMPAFANAESQALFTRDAYHGFMAWGRELAIAMTGMVMQQWPRKDIGIAARLKLQDAIKEMWHALEITKEFRTAEAWTWVNDGNGHMIPIVYGSKPEHHTAANPIQLWSLAVAFADNYLKPIIADILRTPVVQTASGG
jgi:hypothetical protein